MSQFTDICEFLILRYGNFHSEWLSKKRKFCAGSMCLGIFSDKIRKGLE